nr:hypothetical protein [Clostridium botulinum]
MFLITIAIFAFGCGNLLNENQIKNDLIGKKAEDIENCYVENLDKINNLEFISSSKNDTEIKYKVKAEWENQSKKSIVNGELEIIYINEDNQLELELITINSEELVIKPNFEPTDEEVIKELKGQIRYGIGENLELINGEITKSNNICYAFHDDEVKNINISNKHFDENNKYLLFDMEVQAVRNNININLKFDGKIAFTYPEWQVLIDLKNQKIKNDFPSSMEFYFNYNTNFNKVSGICNMKITLDKDNDSYTNGIVNISIDSLTNNFKGSYKVKVNFDKEKNQLFLIQDSWIDKSDDKFNMYDLNLYVNNQFKLSGLLYNNNNKVGLITAK